MNEPLDATQPAKDALPDEVIPAQIMNDMLDRCDCCPFCSMRPCAAVREGRRCEAQCDCTTDAGPA